MPEGHTIHRIARRHRELFAGAPVRAWSPQGRFAGGAAEIDGDVLVGVDAHGKHLFYRFGEDKLLHVHLGLIGSFRTFTDDAPPPTPGTRLALENETAAAYLSGPMHCRMLNQMGMDEITDKLGPDLLRSSRDRKTFAASLRRRRVPICVALLDQGVVAGIGNVYRSEILFLCGIHPSTQAGALSDADVGCIWATIRTQLRRGVALGRIITVNLKDVGVRSRSLLDDDEQRYVYHREGLPCHRCGTEIRRMTIGGRSVWWCSVCQPG